MQDELTKKDKYTIKVDENGLGISGHNGNIFQFSAAEALMLLDILKNEENKLKEAARKASPMPIDINLSAGK